MKRQADENFGSLNESNFGEFLKSRKTIFKPDKLREVWEILSYQLGEEIEKEHVKVLTEQEFKDMGVPIGVIKNLIAWSKEEVSVNWNNISNTTEVQSKDQLPAPSTVCYNTQPTPVFVPLNTSPPTSPSNNQSTTVPGNDHGSPMKYENEMEIDEEDKIINNEINRTTIIWIFKRKGPKSRTEWRCFNKGTQTVEECLKWRNETQIIRVIDPPKLVKKSSHPFPRIISISENGATARISIKGKENEDVLEGNCAPVDSRLREAEFPNFKIKKSSFNQPENIHEKWIFKFEVLDQKESVIMSHETGGIEVVSHLKQLTAAELQINELSPAAGVINVEHKVLITGRFRYDPTLKVLFGDVGKVFEWKTDGILVATGISSNVPQQIPVYLETARIKSNELFFLFHGSTQNPQEMNSSVPSDPSEYSSPPAASHQNTASRNQHNFIHNNGQATHFPVNTNCSYPTFFLLEALKYTLRELKTIRDQAGFTFLHWSCGQGDLKLTQFFLENGFDVDQTDYFGGTPLHWAVFSGSQELVSYLLSKGARWNLEDFYEVTPQYIAEELNLTAILNILHDSMKKEKMEQLFRDACMRGDLNAIKDLVKEEVNMFAKDQNGKTGFELAFENGRQTVIDFLFDNPEYKNQMTSQASMEIVDSPPEFKMKEEITTEQRAEILDKETFKDMVIKRAYNSRDFTIPGDKNKKILYFYDPKVIWELFEPDRDWIEWKEFRKRCNSVSTENIVFLKDGIRYLNVPQNLLRGAKKWFMDDKHERILKSKFVDMLQHFKPIMCLPSKYRKCDQVGFMLFTVFHTLSLHSFAGPVPESDIETKLEASFQGDHRFRFSSSQPVSFTLDFKSNSDEILSKRFIRLNIEGIQDEVGYEVESDSIPRLKFASLVDFEDKIGKDPSIAKQIDITWKDASFNPHEVLGEEEKKLYQLMKNGGLDHLYPCLIYGRELYIDSIEQLKSILLQGDRDCQLGALKNNFKTAEDYNAFRSFFESYLKQQK